MGGGMILETTFLVDVERELIRKTNGPAQRFLADNPASPLFITFTVAGELAAGPPLSERSRWEALVEPFKILVCTADVCWEYGEAFRYLRTNGRLIGSNDLWIAATAIAFQMPLVTRNLKHFARVPRLQVLSYEGT